MIARRSLLLLLTCSLGLLLPSGPAEATLVSIEAMEVTQGLQALRSEPIPLIAGKKLVVRLYLNCNTEQLSVRGWLEVENSTGDRLYISSEPSTGACSGGEISFAKRRADASSSLNFLIGSDHVQEGFLFLRLRQIDNFSTNEIINWEGSSERTFLVEADAPLRLALLSIEFGGQRGKPQLPQESELQQAESWLQRAYPAGKLIVSRRTLASDTRSLNNSCSNINSLILAARNLDLASGTDPRTHYYGMFDPGPGPNRGCALGIPEIDQIMPPVASGLNKANDKDTRKAGKYAGHEIAHTFGAHHFCSPQDEHSCCEPSPGDLVPLTRDGDFVGWDFGDGPDATFEALSGDSWSDIMSYHPNRWVGAQTSRIVRERINKENQLTALDLSKTPLPKGLFVVPTVRYLNVVGSTADRDLFLLFPLVLPPISHDRDPDLSVKDLQARPISGWAGWAYTDPCPGGVTYFDVLVPMSPQRTGIELRWKGFKRKIKFSGPKPPWIKDICIEDARQEGARMALVWNAEDPEKAELQYNVQQSTDGGETWETIGVGLSRKRLILRDGGVGARFRILMTDGINSIIEETQGVPCDIHRKG